MYSGKYTMFIASIWSIIRVKENVFLVFVHCAKKKFCSQIVHRSFNGFFIIFRCKVGRSAPGEFSNHDLLHMRWLFVYSSFAWSTIHERSRAVSHKKHFNRLQCIPNCCKHRRNDLCEQIILPFYQMNIGHSHRIIGTIKWN